MTGWGGFVAGQSAFGACVVVGECHCHLPRPVRCLRKDDTYRRPLPLCYGPDNGPDFLESCLGRRVVVYLRVLVIFCGKTAWTRRIFSLDF